uniref:Uncharacterized protein n=1 Tax=Prolemur simus TaxID=1328070 RepID=A0A8C8YM12_PROSS
MEHPKETNLGSGNPEEGRVVRRQHREKKELQARIQAMKNSVPRSDKKKRKQLHLDVARLEAEMEQKHKQELEKFQENLPDSSNLDSITEDLAKMNLENQPPEISRAQKRVPGKGRNMGW